MSTSGNPFPPFPTDSGGVPAQDFQGVPDYRAGKDLDDALGWLITNAPQLGQAIGSAWDHMQLGEKSLALFWKVVKWGLLEMAKLDTGFLDIWIPIEAQFYEDALPRLLKSGSVQLDAILGLFLQAMIPQLGTENQYGNSSLATPARDLFDAIVQPFTLLQGGADPSQVGSGILNQQHLLVQSLQLGLANWIVDNCGDHLGMGFLKTMRPFLWVIEHAVNPSNVVRQAMNSSFQFLVRAPLTRDLNRKYPIKDLGVAALARLYLRGGIDRQTFLDRCLDAGLSNENAQQLVLESMKSLSTGNVADLLNHGLVAQSDARQLLLQMGYHPDQVDSLLYLETHQRYFQIQDRVGSEAVTAWKKGYITQDRLETLLQQLGFTADEITLLELEGEFVKAHTKSLTRAEVKQAFELNLVDVNYVIQFLTEQGYQPDEIRLLVLMDFTAAAERSTRDAELQARLRVQAEQDRVSAQAAAKKNETALAAAKKSLADELDRAAKQLGTLQTLPGVLSLLGQL